MKIKGEGDVGEKKCDREGDPLKPDTDIGGSKENKMSIKKKIPSCSCFCYPYSSFIYIHGWTGWMDG